jgi:class 3 adenylate cyclase
MPTRVEVVSTRVELVSTRVEITAGLSDARIPGEQEATKLLRDRAFTHLDRLVIDLRKAGRYAFRKEPERAAAFASDYLRRVRAKARRRAGERVETAAAAAAASTEE